ncbi:MAG: tRNA uridine-5-carboxymethylaminomethyl(34) synthesis GTPase MnmE [Campylobacter sp.]|nr:tRNA uridine-5-carboxymethylaminomethyl(34) synthesis GTPase MnmE [Campylobacter sp.]
MNDTIVANATANGVGAICVIRLSGKDALKLAATLSSKTLQPRYATLCKLRDKNGEYIDEAILIYFKAPHSFTGEDVVEFQTHGGFVVATMIIEELISLGARLAMPGEFSKRAFLNSKMDYAKASAISAIINAKSQNSVKILSKVMQGELSKFVDGLRDELVKTLAYAETCIDYSDEDLPKDLLFTTDDMLSKNINLLDEIVAISEQRKGLIEGFKVAIVGKPNVGKSSILNSLLKSERAIVSSEEGTTRDTIEESLIVGTNLIKIVDTAGIRNPASYVESLGIQNSMKAIYEADAVIAVFDGSEVSNEKDKKILEILAACNKKIFYALNKSDLKLKFDLNLPNPIKLCAKSNTKPLIDELSKYFNSQDSSQLILTNLNQINSCKNASLHLKRSREFLSDEELELFAMELNLAINELSNITRPFYRDEILDKMFSSFCLGK